MKIVPATVALLACVTSGVTAPALAATTASSELSRLSFSLTDLAPADGVGPSLTWTGGEAFYQLGAQQRDGTSQLERSSVAALQRVDRSVGVAGASAQVVMDASHGLAAAQADFTPGLSASAWAIPRDGFAFKLSPHTLLTIDLAFTLSATASVGFDPVSRLQEEAGGWFIFSLAGRGPNGEPGTSQGQSHNRIVQAGWFQDCSVSPDCPYQYRPQDSGDHAFQVTFQNLSDAPLGGFFDVQLSALADARILPVPEPTTPALMLAGLALMFAASGRKLLRGPSARTTA